MLSTQYRLRLEEICGRIARHEPVGLEDMIWAEKLAKANRHAATILRQARRKAENPDMQEGDLDDFLNQLNEKEFENLRSQFATSCWGGRRTLPYVFTEHGVLMLSSVLNSPRAIEVNIQIMRVFVQTRTAILENQILLKKIEQLEQYTHQNSEDIQYVFSVVKEMIQKKAEPRKRIGF
jgi:hypothetical protein